MGTSGNGVRTGTDRILHHQLQIPLVPRAVILKSYAVVAGVAVLESVDLLVAAEVVKLPTIDTLISDSVLPGIFDYSLHIVTFTFGAGITRPFFF